MLRQHRNGQGKIGFESAKAGSIDQGRQHVEIKCKVKEVMDCAKQVGSKVTKVIAF